MKLESQLHLGCCMGMYASDTGYRLYFSQNVLFSGLFYQRLSFSFSSGLWTVSQKVHVLDQWTLNPNCIKGTEWESVYQMLNLNYIFRKMFNLLNIASFINGKALERGTTKMGAFSALIYTREEPRSTPPRFKRIFKICIMLTQLKTRSRCFDNWIPYVSMYVV